MPPSISLAPHSLHRPHGLQPSSPRRESDSLQRLHGWQPSTPRRESERARAGAAEAEPSLSALARGALRHGLTWMPVEEVAGVRSPASYPKDPNESCRTPRQHARVSALTQRRATTNAAAVTDHVSSTFSSERLVTPLESFACRPRCDSSSRTSSVERGLSPRTSRPATSSFAEVRARVGISPKDTCLNAALNTACWHEGSSSRNNSAEHSPLPRPIRPGTPTSVELRTAPAIAPGETWLRAMTVSDAIVCDDWRFVPGSGRVKMTSPEHQHAKFTPSPRAVVSSTGSRRFPPRRCSVEQSDSDVEAAALTKYSWGREAAAAACAAAAIEAVRRGGGTPRCGGSVTGAVAAVDVPHDDHSSSSSTCRRVAATPPRPRQPSQLESSASRGAPEAAVLRLAAAEPPVPKLDVATLRSLDLAARLLAPELEFQEVNLGSSRASSNGGGDSECHGRKLSGMDAHRYASSGSLSVTDSEGGASSTRASSDVSPTTPAVGSAPTEN